MKRLVIVYWCFILASCTTWSPEIKKITKQSMKSITYYQPKQVTHQLNELNIKISPMDPYDLDTKLNYLSNLTGDCYFEYNETKLKTIKQSTNTNKINRKDIEKSVKELCESLNKNELYQQEILYKILNHYNLIDSNPQKIAETDFKNNPFIIDGKALSVFKIIFENNTSNVKTFEISNVRIYNSNEQLLPLTYSFLSSFQQSKIKYILLERIYIPSTIQIEPNQIVVKYFATFPFDEEDENIDLYIANNKYSININKNVEIQNIEEEYRLLQFNPYMSGSMIPVNCETGKSYSVIEGKIYIPTKQKSNLIDMVIFGYNENQNKFWITIKQNLPTDSDSIDVYY